MCILKKYAYIGLLICNLLSMTGIAQRMNAYTFDNLSGIPAVIVNPANVADSRYKMNVHILGTDVYAANNFINVRTPYAQFRSLTGNIDTQYIDKNGVPVFTDNFVIEKLNGRKKFVNVQYAYQLPSVMWTGKDRAGFAFNWQMRANAHVSGLNEDIMKIFLEDFDTTGSDYTPYQNQKRYIGITGNQKNMSAGANAWLEYNFSYGSILYEDRAHLIKGGATLKLLEGIGAAYLRVNNLDYELQRVDSINFWNADIEYGYVSEKYYDRNPPLKARNLLGSGSPGWGLGLDLGVIYEYRPQYKKYVYQMDRERWIDPSQNKYLYKVGVSLVDWGRIRYKKENYTKFVHIQSGPDLVGWSQFKQFQKYDEGREIDGFMYRLFPGSDSGNVFRARLPLAANFTYDHNLGNHFYIGTRYIQSLRRKKVDGVRAQNTLSVVARYERDKYGASMGLTMGRFYNPVQLSMVLRGGPFYIGSDILGGVTGGKNTSGISFYTGFMVPLLAHKQKDTDGDMLSDALDQCPKVPGDPFADGCPDRDGDKINDYIDDCPDLYGPAQYKGCPDDDNDGIIGYKDKCPFAKGDSLHFGCPDSDGDGLFDYEDECTTEQGPINLKGCPDRDRDTIPDHLDECPDLYGIRSLKGCPPPETFFTGDKRVDSCDFKKYKYRVQVGNFIARSDAEKYTVVLRKQLELLASVEYDKKTKFYYVFVAEPVNAQDAFQWLTRLDKPAAKKHLSQKAILQRKE